MKFIKFEVPKRLSKQIRDWAFNSDYRQSDLLCWLADNLPPAPVVKPNSQLINYLDDPKNIQILKKTLSEDDLRMFELIANGFVTPTPEEKKLIERLTKIVIDPKK